MASTQLLSHNPSIVHDLETSGSGSWTALAENVGFGPSEDPGVLFQAYMNSPPHRANILDRSTRYLGVGTVERSGIAWNTLDFVNAYSSRYGMTRVPAAGMAMDRVTIRRTTDVAMLESSQDQRFGTRGSGAVKASPVGFTGPTAANDAAYLRMHTVGSGRGAGSLIMRDALVLSHADAVLLQLAANSPSGRSVPVRVTLRRSFGADVLLGTVSVGPHARFVTLSLPSAARNFRNTLVLTVSGQAVRHAGGRLRLALFDVRARVAQ
jgi:hypothetical protein